MNIFLHKIWKIKYYIQWDPSFLRLVGRRRSVGIIWRFENSWVKLQCVTETLGADWRLEVNFVSRGLRNRPGVLPYRKRIFYKGMHSHWILIDETHCEILSISQFQLRPLPLPRATAVHWPALSVPGVGHLQILCCPGDGHLPTPRFWHADDFTGKTRRLAHLSRTGKNWSRIVKACSRFYACISSLLIKPELHMSETRELSTWINVSLVIESSFPWYYLKNILSYWNHKLVSSRRQLTAWSVN